jgi:hypothetical protein
MDNFKPPYMCLKIDNTDFVETDERGGDWIKFMNELKTALRKHYGEKKFYIPECDEYWTAGKIFSWSHQIFYKEGDSFILWLKLKYTDKNLHFIEYSYENNAYFRDSMSHYTKYSMNRGWKYDEKNDIECGQ